MAENQGSGWQRNTKENARREHLRKIALQRQISRTPNYTVEDINNEYKRRLGIPIENYTARNEQFRRFFQNYNTTELNNLYRQAVDNKRLVQNVVQQFNQARSNIPQQQQNVTAGTALESINATAPAPSLAQVTFNKSQKPQRELKDISKEILKVLEVTKDRECSCEGSGKVDKSFCFAETSAIDRSKGGGVREISENVWYGLKPPRSLGSAVAPYVSARTIHVIREKLKAKWKKQPIDDAIVKQVPTVPRAKKILAAKYLSKPDI